VTNGNFGTQVLANDMYANAFQFQNYGRGAALAVLILLSVLPVMILNIRRMQEDR
jgi:alpha-glucoside transport system permease protein